MYKVLHDATIKPMPSDMKAWLLEHLYTINTNTKATKKKGTSQVKEMTPTKHSYNLCESELKDIIDKLPDKYWSNENHGFLKFTSFCKFFEIKDLWDNINKQKPKYNYENNIQCYWNGANCSENVIDEILSDEYINYAKYKPVPQNTLKPNRTIKKKKLGYSFFKTNKNYLVKSDTGTGKTTSFKHYVKDNNLKFISLVSRISLADEQYNTFSEHGIQCKNYQIAESLCNGENVIITVDSIRRLYDFDFTEYVIFLDEYNSLLEYLVTANTLAKNRSLIYLKVIHMLKTCKQVICTDADLNDVSINWMRLHTSNATYIQNTYQHNKDVLAYEMKSFSHMIDKLKLESKFHPYQTSPSLHCIFPSSQILFALDF